MNAREALFKLAPAGSVEVIHEPLLNGCDREFHFDPPEHAHPKRVFVSTAIWEELKKLPKAS
jgi:hypothetical protein